MILSKLLSMKNKTLTNYCVYCNVLMLMLQSCVPDEDKWLCSVVVVCSGHANSCRLCSLVGSVYDEAYNEHIPLCEDNTMHIQYNAMITQCSVCKTVYVSIYRNKCCLSQSLNKL